MAKRKNNVNLDDIEKGYNITLNNNMAVLKRSRF